MIAKWNAPRALAALILPAVALMAPGAAKADIVVSVEGPGVQQTSVTDVVTETFDSLPVGPNGTVINSSIGTYSATSVGDIGISGPDAYGGAYETNYLSVGGYVGGTTSPAYVSATQVTLTFDSAQGYFGFYFAAIDGTNRVEFFNGATSLGVVDINTPIIAGLSGDYYGNPNNGQDGGERFVYVNVTSATKFTSVVFTNDSGSGLETDNHSIRAVPEPASMAMLATGGLGLLGAIRRRKDRIS